jgi:hypothetical protein
VSRFSRTGWKNIPPSPPIRAMLPNAMVYQKEVDLEGFHGHGLEPTPKGRLQVIVGPEPIGFHLSISFTPLFGAKARYPSWEEIIEARWEFCPPAMTLAMLLPPKEQYVNLHDTTFHLWEVDGSAPPAQGLHTI